MKIVPVTQSYSEAKTYRILDSVLSKRSYKILASVRLQDVLKVEPDDHLDRFEETYFYRQAHFDFVICRQQGLTPLMPLFAVEFDGPQHETDDAQKRRDELKNRLCKDASFPLLRITSEQIEEHERVSLLAFMLERYLAWQRESSAIWEECRERLEQHAPDDPIIREMNESGILDPEFDPSFWFNLAHPFPARLTVVHRLKRNGIFTSSTYEAMGRYIGQHKPTFVYIVEPALHSNVPSLPDTPERWSCTTVMHLCRQRAVQAPIRYSVRWSVGWTEVTSDPPGLVEVLYTVTKTVALKWACPTGRLLLEKGPFGHPVQDLLFCDLPGVHIPDIAEDLSQYLCLRDIERWATNNLAGPAVVGRR